MKSGGQSCRLRRVGAGKSVSCILGDVRDTESESTTFKASVWETELKSCGQKVTSVCQSGDGDEGGHQTEESSWLGSS